MSERLKNTLAFADLAPGAAVVLPHGLNTGVGGPRPLAPDIIFIPNPDLDVTASNEVAVTLTNRGPTVLSGAILVEAWHTLERAFNGVQNVDLPVKPYVVVSAESEGAPPQPPFPVPQTTLVIYARMTGNDATGTGTLLNPYRTFVRAVRDVPTNIPPGVLYFIDISGVGGVQFTEVLPDNYAVPAWKAPLVFNEDFADPLFFLMPAVTIRAVPQLVTAIPPADAVIGLGDIASIESDPVTGLITYTLNVARASWGVNGLQGKFVIDPVNSFLNCAIHENTTTTLSICQNQPLTTPFQIMEPSAHLSGAGVTPGFQGALNVVACDSIALLGIKVTSTVGGLGLFMVGNGFQCVNLCELESPDIESRHTYWNRILRSYIYGFPIIAGDCFINHCFLKDATAGGPGFELFFANPTAFQISRSVFDACDPVSFMSLFSPDGSNDAFIPERAAVASFRMNSTLIRNGLEHGVVFNGSHGTILDTNIVGCNGDGVRADEGSGNLRLFHVRSNGDPNLGAGVFVDDGMFVRVDAATSCPLISGTGDSFAFALGVVTLTDAAALFTAAMVGARLVIDGATSPGNNGTFTVTAVGGGGTTVTYDNPTGATEAFPGTWTTTQPLIGALGEMLVGDFSTRTWEDFTDAAPASGHPQYNEYNVTSAAATGATGTGSRLYQK